MLANNSIKIVVFVGTMRSMGGAERQALYLVEHLVANTRCQVDVLAIEDGQANRPILDAINVPVHVVPYYARWPKMQRLKGLAKMTRLLRSLQADVILPFIGIHSKMLGMVWPYTKAKYCWWNQQDEGRDLAKTDVERKILERASCINSNSVEGQQFLSSAYDLDPEKILVYNNGTPVPDFGELNHELRSQWELSSRPVVSMVANLTRFKDHKTLLDAWPIVQKALPDQDPVLLLAGHHYETETVTQLKIQAFENGLNNDQVRMLGSVQDVPALMLASDVVVHSSVTEGCPNAVCEAMALGRPVVATDISGCRQALGEKAERHLVLPKDPQSLADKLIELLQDATLREQAGQANRCRIKSEFTIEGMNQFFQGLVESGLECELPSK